MKFRSSYHFDLVAHIFYKTQQMYIEFHDLNGDKQILLVKSFVEEYVNWYFPRPYYMNLKLQDGFPILVDGSYEIKLDSYVKVRLLTRT